MAGRPSRMAGCESNLAPRWGYSSLQYAYPVRPPTRHATERKAYARYRHCFSADVDRLLGLADQFLDDRAEDAVQGGKPDEDYEQQSTEWTVIRTLLISAQAMLKGLKKIARFSQGSFDPIALCYAAVARTALDEFLNEVAA